MTPLGSTAAVALVDPLLEQIDRHVVLGSNRALTQPDLPSPYPVGSAQENIVIAASPESDSLHDIP